MKAIAMVAAAAALAGLAGCDRLGIGGGGANGSANAAAANASAGGGKDVATANQAAAPGAEPAGGKDMAAGATPAAAGGVALDRTFMMGRWTDNNDCGNVIEFTQDGRFIAANGGTGLWNLEGDRLTMSGRETATIRIVPIDQDTITVVNPDGSLGRSTRC